MINPFKYTSAEIGLYIYFLVERIIPVFVAVFVIGQMTRSYYDKLTDFIDTVAPYLGVVPKLKNSLII